MKRFLREPLVHFLLIGAVLFGVHSFTQAGRAGPAASKEIRLSYDELAQLVLLFKSQWRRERRLAPSRWSPGIWERCAPASRSTASPTCSRR